MNHSFYLAAAVTRESLEQSKPVLDEVSPLWSVLFGGIFVVGFIVFMVALLREREDKARTFFALSLIFSVGGAIAVYGVYGMFMAPLNYATENSAWMEERTKWQETLPVERVELLDKQITSSGIVAILKTDKPVSQITIQGKVEYGGTDDPYVTASWVAPFGEEDGEGYWTNASMHYPDNQISK